MKTTYDKTCDVKSVDNGTTLTADVMEFMPENRLVVSLNKSVKVTMMYNKIKKKYVSSMAGLDFESNGPREYTVKEGRYR